MKLQFTGACSGKYWDENGSHLVQPGDVVEFTPAMSKERLKEAVWIEYKEPVMVKERPAKAGKDGE